MKTIIILVALLLPASAPAFDPWNTQDVALEVTWQLVHLIDWGQTRNIAAHPEKYREINPILGDHPSRQKVNLYMATGTLVHLGITHVLPKRCRPYFQGVTIGLSGACVLHNFNIGLQVRF